ncbi:MAG: GntR family transcriptional regulator [Armatimonadota bacterium]|nr:GntR family transcriptional regulator [Armatimonadota bacterium]
MSLDNNSPLPKHFQLREAIRRDVLVRGLRPGDLIPSERELVRIYDVSRVTVRRAIRDLVEEGFLRREGRRGTFVNDITRTSTWSVGNQSKLIGVLISRIQTSFSDELLGGIDDCCHEHGYSVLFGATDEDIDEATRRIERMASGGVLGFIIVPIACDDYVQVNTELLESISRRGLPYVLLDRYVPGIKADTVVSDNFDGAYRATKHLIDLGHKRIGFVGYFKCSSVEDRIAGYKKCLMDHGILPDDSLVVNPRPEEVKRAAAELVRRAPDMTAIFAVNDAKAMLVWESLTELGLRVPKDIALVGYDNLYGSTGPGALLTTTKQPLREEGLTASKMLIERIEGYTGEPRMAVLKSEFIVGQSTVAGSASPVSATATAASEPVGS